MGKMHYEIGNRLSANEAIDLIDNYPLGILCALHIGLYDTVFTGLKLKLYE